MAVRVIVAAILLLSIAFGAAAHGPGGSSLTPDPFTLIDQRGYGDTSAVTPRPQIINPALRNGIIILAGQSQCTSITPTPYTPTSSTVVDNLSIIDGGSYSINGPLLGAQSAPLTGGIGGPGNVGARLAQPFITNNIVDHVIVVSTCIGSTLAADWATGSERDRIVVALRRLASRGITPTTPGVTFVAISWWQGEQDAVAGTSAASYQASIATILANAQAAGFSCATCRFFVNVETWDVGAVSATIQGAQAAVVNNTTIFAGGKLDTLNASNRQGDNIHFNDTGAAAAASLVYNAMHASGAPFLWQPPFAANDNWQALEGCNDNTSDLCKAM